MAKKTIDDTGAKRNKKISLSITTKMYAEIFALAKLAEVESGKVSAEEIEFLLAPNVSGYIINLIQNEIDKNSVLLKKAKIPLKGAATALKKIAAGETSSADETPSKARRKKDNAQNKKAAPSEDAGENPEVDGDND